MKHDLIKKLYYEWQDYNERFGYFGCFIYFNEFLESKGYKYDVLAVGKKVVIYKVKIENLIYLVNDYGITVEIRYYNDKLKNYINIHKYLI